MRHIPAILVAAVLALLAAHVPRGRDAVPLPALFSFAVSAFRGRIG